MGLSAKYPKTECFELMYVADSLPESRHDMRDDYNRSILSINRFVP
jgi:hypothetical protein